MRTRRARGSRHGHNMWPRVAAWRAPLVSAMFIALLNELPLRAQQPAAPGPAFEVAAVKLNKSGENRASLGPATGGRFNAANVTLRMLIAAAYGAGQPLPNFQMAGGPNWLDKDRFDITAKVQSSPQAGTNTPPEQLFLMLRTLLAERFKLVVHNERRELPIFVLVMARSDRKLGPQLRPSATDCAALMRSGPPRLDQNGGPTCGTRVGVGRLTAGGMRMSTLATSLSRLVNRVVMDRTDLDGVFDANLEWTPTPDQLPPGLPPPGAASLAPGDPNGPSIFTAVQEQLGLKLDSQRGPVDVVVIDRAEQPIVD